MSPHPAVDIRGVTLQRAGIPVLSDIDLCIPRGVTQVIIGPSGAGKTTLLKTICGLLQPDRGSVEVFGVRVGSAPFGTLRPHIGYIPQTMGLVQLLTAEQNVLAGSLPHLPFWKSLLPVFPAHERRKAHEKLALLGMSDKRDVPVHRLSGGEKRRVAIARALMQDPVLLLADEILSDLDFLKSASIMEVIHGLKRDLGLTVVLVEHDLHVAQQFADHVAMMREGSLRAGVDVAHVTHSKLHTFFS